MTAVPPEDDSVEFGTFDFGSIEIPCPRCRRPIPFSREAVSVESTGEPSVECGYCGSWIPVAAFGPDVLASIDTSEEMPEPKADKGQQAKKTGKAVDRPQRSGRPEKPSKDRLPKALPLTEHAGLETPLVRRSKEIDQEDLIDMTAMVDIVFFLLIFFLVTSLHPLESSIQFPVPKPSEGGRASTTLDQLLDEQVAEIEVTIDANNAVRIQGLPMKDTADVVARLRELANAPTKPRGMIVIGDGDASHGTAVAVMDAGYEVGFEKIRFAVEPDKRRR